MSLVVRQVQQVPIPGDFWKRGYGHEVDGEPVKHPRALLRGWSYCGVANTPALRLRDVLHDDHKQIADDACTGVEGWGEREIVFGEQVMSVFVVFCRELDQNLAGRDIVLDLHRRKVHRTWLVDFIDGLEWRTENMIHFREDLE